MTSQTSGKATVMSLLCALLPLLAACSAPEPNARPAFYASLAAPDARVDLASAQSVLNGYRRTAGLGPVRVDPVLVRLAEEQVRAMAAADTVSHDVRGPLKDRLATAGLGSARAAENVSAGYHTVSDSFSGWRGSPSHDANMRLASATRMGLATAYAPGSKYRVFWTLIMAE